MTFQLPDLPFAKDALAPHMSAETLEYHHGKHHRAYVNKTNELIESDAALSGASLLQVVKEAKRAGNNKLFNNSAQLWNHSFFWQCLAPAEGQTPDGRRARHRWR
jgi:Fe-Mn family superoxide dismutase